MGAWLSSMFIKTSSKSRQSIANSSFLRSAVKYNPILSNFEEISPKESDGKTLLCGPVDKQEQSRRMKMFKQHKSKKEDTSNQKAPGYRKLIIMRHGERMDRIFVGWTKISFAEKCTYRPYDLNMPVNMPTRANFLHFAGDSPLTEVGDVTSMLIGKCMRMSKHTVTQIYCSPALRCLQTAHDIQKGCRRDYRCKINIEPGLFEYLGWYDKEFVEWMTYEEMIDGNYDINSDYKPIISVQEMRTSRRSESVADYYKRSHLVIQEILKRNSVPDTNVFIVAHAPSVDACSRQLLQRPLSLPNSLDAKMIGQSYPYCCILILQENDDKSWSVVDKSVPNLTCYEYCNRIDTKNFNRP